MPRTGSLSALWTLVISLTAFMHAQSGPSESSSKAIEKDLTFPSPVQWMANGAEISLIHVVWGPEDSQEVLSKGRENVGREKPTFYPDRPYVLALGFRAKSVIAVPTISYTSSGLVRVKDADGNVEAPMVLTPSGFVPFSGSPGVYDVHFDKNTITDYWDLFPIAQGQNEFLFQVFPWNVNLPRLSFRIVLVGDAVVISDVSPQVGTACLELHSNFTGTVGARAPVKIQLARKNNNLSGTEQYERVGKTLWLRGTSDSLGNFVLEERYPEEQVTGIFKGKFSNGHHAMHGYFSKPDGSRLLPFEFRQMDPVGSQLRAPNQDCWTDQAAPETNSDQ